MGFFSEEKGKTNFVIGYEKLFNLIENFHSLLCGLLLCSPFHGFLKSFRKGSDLCDTIS